MCLAAIAAFRSRLVAASTRTSTEIDWLPPTRSNLPLLEHSQQGDLGLGRQIADLVEKDRPAIGQLKASQRAACSAPVKAPFSCPNSSEAISDGGIAAQFTRIRTRATRACERL